MACINCLDHNTTTSENGIDLKFKNNCECNNELKCNKCEDVIYSAHRHDYVECKCGKVAVDGGMAYIRILGSDYTDMSVVIEDDAFDAIMLALDWCNENGRNDLGRICAIGRYLRDMGYEITKKEV